MDHIPVLQKEVLEYLEPKPNENFVDCTISGAGHSLAILGKNAPKGKVMGIEADQEIYKDLQDRLKSKDIRLRNRLILINSSFANLKEIVDERKFRPVHGILLDLGMSSWHLEKSGRGFSFLRNEPLDMRYDTSGQLKAEKIINYWSESEIEKILREYGEERFSRKIAKEIVVSRKIKPVINTFQLAEIIKRAVPAIYQQGKIHFATRTFQALRIAVNNELGSIRKTLPQTLEILSSGGRLVVISFHSLEDRIVKNFFRDKAKENILKIITKRPINPNQKEIKINPRSRSSKLRAAIKL